MPKSDDRFYLLEFKHRPAMWGDVGSNVRIQGLVVGGAGSKAILMLPGEKIDLSRVSAFTLDVEEWSEFIHYSDDPQILIGPAKVFQRKVRYEISGAVQQKVWATDGFKCKYCGAEMGKVLMTIDHFIPLETGGLNDASNFITCCKPCNKAKGSIPTEQFCAERGIDFAALRDYLRDRKLRF